MMDNIRVLIVEDENIVRLHLRKIVEELGYTMTGLASSAQEAFESAAEETPDLVLMDIHLADDGDGVEVARELRARYGMAVVFVTAYADKATVERTQEIGAVGYIVKPFSQAQVRAVLSTALTEHRTLQRARESADSLNSILGSLGDGVIVTDVSGVITFLNRQAAGLTGWSLAMANGRPVYDILSVAKDDGATDLHRLLRTALEEGHDAAFSEVSLVARDGCERPIEGEIERLIDPGDSGGGIVVVLRDVSRKWDAKVSQRNEELRDFGAGARMLIYSHDTFGLGHLQRCLNISRTLVARFPKLSILLVTGSAVVHRYKLPSGVDYVKLPAVRKVASEKYEARCLSMSRGGVLKLRSNLLLRTVRDFDPNVVLVDHSPIGMRGEMLPALEWLQKNSSCVKILGMRDIIDDPDSVRSLWKRQGVYDVLTRLYDHVVIYGMPRVFDPVSAYAFSDELRSKTSFLSYIGDGAVKDGDSAVDDAESRPIVVVTIGGGDGAGETVIGSYLEMVRKFQYEIDFASVILSGPFLSADLLEKYRRDIQGLPVTIREFVPSTSPFLQCADLVVCTAGYNTMTQTIGHARRALVIPRIMHRREQILRAQRLSEMNLVTLLHPDEVTPELLYEHVTAMLANEEEPLARGRSEDLIRLDGASRLADFLATLRVSQSHPQEATSD